MGMRDKMGSLRTPEQFLPSTFEERGTAVPFTTPMYAFARVRKDYRDRLELLVTRFSDGAGVYVVPWTAVPELAQLTTHDAVLHEEVLQKRVLNPFDMRLASLVVAATGLAGPVAAETATKRIAEDEESKALNQVILILKVIELAQRAAAPALLREILTPAGQTRIRETLFEIADKLDLAPELLDRRLSELGLCTYPVGVAWSPMEGRLRGIMKRTEEMRAALLAWAEDQLGEVSEQARFCAQVADHTLRICKQVLIDFDAEVADPAAIVAVWDEKRPVIENLSGRLAWLLDGWQPIADMWLDSAAADVGARAATLLEILSMLPLLPRKETEGPDHGRVAEAMASRRRTWVRAAEDWRTGEVDSDLVQRLEGLKAKAA